MRGRDRDKWSESESDWSAGVCKTQSKERRSVQRERERRPASEETEKESRRVDAKVVRKERGGIREKRERE